MNSEGNYSMNSNPGEDQWGQFGFDGAPEPEKQESLQEKQAERGAKTVETVKSELEQKLKSLEEAYQNASETDKAGIAQEYASIYQELANVERGAGINAEKSQTGEEEKRNSVVEKLPNNKGATNYKIVLAMTALGGLLGLTAVMNILGIISNSGLVKAKEKAPEEPKQQTEADTNSIETTTETSVEDNEQLKTYDEWLKADNEEAQARYDKMNRLLDGKIFNGEKLPGMWDDDVSKNAVISSTDREVDNDLMTSQVVYNMICEDPSNPTLEEERMVSLSGTLAEPEKALILLRDTLKVPELQGMSNDEGVAYLKGLSEDSAEFKSYTGKIVDFHTNSELRVENNIDIENEILAKIPEEYRPEAKKWLEEHIYVNRQTGRIEAMVLPTGDDEQVLVWEYKDEKGEARIAMEIKKCRNYFVITITPDGKIEISADEGTPSGEEPTPSAEEPTPSAIEPSAEEPTPSAIEPSAEEPTPSAAGSEHTPKNPDSLNDPNKKGDGDPQELDVDVTPSTTEDEDKENLDELKKREEEDKQKKEEEEKIKKDQEEAEKKAKEEAEKKRKEEEEKKKQLDEEARKKAEEEEKKADEAKKKAEEEAQKEQEKRAEEERKRKEEEDARIKAQEEADQREKENRDEAENNSNKGADDRANDFINGDF